MFKSLKRRVALGAVAAVGAAGLVTIAAPAANAAANLTAFTVGVFPQRATTGDNVNLPSGVNSRTITALVTTTGTDTGTIIGKITSAPTPASADSLTAVAAGDTLTATYTDWSGAATYTTVPATGAVFTAKRAGASGPNFNTAGTYTVTWWFDKTANNLIDADEPFSVSTFTIGGRPTALSLASSALTVAGTGNKTFNVLLKDANGAPTSLAGNERVTMLATSLIETMTVTGGAASGNRVATATGAPNATNTAASYIASGDTQTASTGAYPISASLTGAASGTIAFNLGGTLDPVAAVTGTLTASAVGYATSIALTNTAGVTAHNTVAKPGAGNVTNSGLKFVAPQVMDTGFAADGTFYEVDANATTAAVLNFALTGTAGAIVNVTLASSQYADNGIVPGTTAVTLDASGKATYTVTPVVATGTIKVTTSMAAADGVKRATGYAVTYAASAVTAAVMASNGITSDPDLSKVTSTIVKTGSTTSVKVTVKDQYGVGKQYYAVTGSLTATSRNYGATITQQFTDASGVATISLTDASTSTTNLSDVLTVQITAPGSSSPLLTDQTGSNKLTITYSSSGTYASLALTGGTTSTAEVKKDILNADDATNYAVTLTPALKDSTGNVISGVALTYTGSAGVKFRSAVATRTTGGDLGTLTAASQTAVYAYGTKPGTATVTVTGGGLTATATFTVNAIAAVTTARSVAVTASGNKFTAVVTDGWGNVVPGVTLSFATTSQGIFGGGVTSTSAVTDASGAATAVVSSADGKAGDVTVSATIADAGTQKASLATSPVTDFAAGLATASAKGAVTATTTTATTDAATTSKINDIATAVANLSTTVAGLVASLVAQIKDTKAAIADTKAALDKLAAVVAKIQKKVKA